MSSTKRNSYIKVHAVPKFVFEKQKLSLWVTTDSDTVFSEESIGEGFKIVTDFELYIKIYK